MKSDVNNKIIVEGLNLESKVSDTVWKINLIWYVALPKH